MGKTTKTLLVISLAGFLAGIVFTAGLVDAENTVLYVALPLGAVFFGAMTYIGNGPNFMVKAIAEQHHVRMPGFFGYVLWSFAILVPLFGIVSAMFF